MKGELLDGRQSITLFSSSGRDTPAELLEGAAQVTCFVKEAAIHLFEKNNHSNMTEDAVSGLYILLEGVEDTIRHVSRSV